MMQLALAAAIEIGLCMFDARRSYLNWIAGL